MAIILNLTYKLEILVNNQSNVNVFLKYTSKSSTRRGKWREREGEREGEREREK